MQESSKTEHRPGSTNKAFSFKHNQHAEALQLASDMFQTGLDGVWKHGSLVEHGLAAGTGGVLLAKVAAICDDMIGGRYTPADKALLAMTLAALEVWVRENTPKTYDVGVALKGIRRGPWRIRSVSPKSAIKTAQNLLTLQGIKYDFMDVRRVKDS